MNTIFSGEAFEILPLTNGIIYSYNGEAIDEVQRLVLYKMVSFETARATDAGRNVYLITKYGNNYREIIKNCDNFVTTKSVLLPNGRNLILNNKSDAVLIDNDGESIWQGSLIYRSCKPSDVVFHNNALWVSYEECNAIVKYNISTMREELRIGGNKSPFNKPSGLFIEQDNVIVCNKGTNNLVCVNLNSYTVEELEKFNEPLIQYVSVKENRFVLLKSGIYLI